MDMTDEETREEIGTKRLAVILGVWEQLVAAEKFDPRRLKLATPLVNEVIEYYLNDLSILKQRYRIEANLIQLHKIAGLMTAAILRFRPIVPLTDEVEGEYELYANELLAIIHGVVICGEYAAKDGTLDILDEPWFNPWLKDFLFLLHFRHVTSEGLIFIFQTLTVLRFPGNLIKED